MKMAVWATHLPFILCIAVIFIYLETAHAQGNNCPRSEPCQPGTRLPDVDNCRKYFECNKGGRRWRHPSCKRQQNFDSVTLECVDEENANCAVNCVVGQIQTETVRDPCSPPAVPCDLGTVEQNFKNCSSFYICEGDSWSKRPCRQEYLFDPATKLCVPQELSACEETCVLIDEPIDLPDDFFPFPPASDPPVVTPYPEFTITPQQDFPLTDIAPISSSINETIIDLACDPRTDCPPFIRLPDPQDCTRSFFCVQGVRAVQPCPQGQQFDAVTLQCQERNKATCMPSCDSFKITTPGGLTLPDYKLSTSPDDNAETTTIDIARDPIFGRLAQAMLKLACNLPPLCFLNEQIPVPGNCSAYYYCDTAVSRTYKVGFCPQGQQFDIVQRECARGNVVCMPALPCDPTAPQTSTVLATETSTVNVPTTSTITYPQASTLPDTDPPSPDTTSTIRPPSTRPSKAPTRVTEPPSTLPELVTTDPQVPVAPVTVKPGRTSTVIYSKLTSSNRFPTSAASTAAITGTNATSNVSPTTESMGLTLTTNSTESFSSASTNANEYTTVVAHQTTADFTSENNDFKTNDYFQTVSTDTAQSTQMTDSSTNKPFTVAGTSQTTRTESVMTTTDDVSMTETVTQTVTPEAGTTPDMPTSAILPQTTETLLATTEDEEMTTEAPEITTVLAKKTTQEPEVTTYFETTSAADTMLSTEAVTEMTTESDELETTASPDVTTAGPETTFRSQSSTRHPSPTSQETTTDGPEMSTRSFNPVEETTSHELTSKYQGTTEGVRSSTEGTLKITEHIDKVLTTERSTSTPSSIKMCESNVDSDGLNWISTLAGQEAVLPCPPSSKGSIIRRCVLNTDGKAMWEEQVDFCVDKEYLDILNLAETIVPGDKASLERTKDISEKLRNTILQDVAINKELSAGNLNASVEAVLTLSGIDIFGATVDPEVTQVTLINTAFSADGLLSLNNSNSWQKILQQNKDGAVKLLNATDNIGRGIASTLPVGSTMNISLENFAIQTVALPRNLTKAVSFNVDISEGAPLLQLNYSSTDSSTAIDSIEVKPETLRAMARSAKTENLVMWTTYHATLDMLMPATKNMIINSRILALTVKDLESGFTFQPPITLRFTPLNKTLLINETYCSFWKYTSMTSGYWSQEGCTLMKTNANQTTCECNHLTNFAVLVSPYLADGLHARILSLISLIGCLLSILGCFATMVFYMLAWKEVKSQHAIVLLNLCAVLIIANVVFLVGIDKVRYELVCTIVAALLHYFWLVAFMVMLADGVMFILYVVYVFHVKRKRETVLLLVTSWLVPAVIVGVTLGVTRTKGYGTNEYCWLERTSGLVAAFIAPVAVIVVANFVVLIKVLHTAATSKSNEHKNRSRLRAVVWNIMVVLPLLGIAWIFGLLSVNEDTIAFQYIFAISNSLQGFFIFIFHCALNKKVRNGVSSRFSVRGSTTNSLKSNKSANLKNLNGKNNNGFNAQEEKAKKSIQRAHQRECPAPPHRSPWLPRSQFGQSGDQEIKEKQGFNNEAFEGDTKDNKSIRRQIEKFQLSDRAANSITVFPEYCKDIGEVTPMFTENDPIYMDIDDMDSPKDNAQTISQSL